MGNHKRLGPNTTCTRCGKEDVDCDLTLGKVEERYRTTQYCWLCESCKDAVWDFAHGQKADW